MPVSLEILQWLDEEDGSLANQDLFLVLNRIWERLHVQGRPEGEIAGILRTLSPLEFLAHGKHPHIWGSIFSPKREADPAQGVEEYPRLADLNEADVEVWTELALKLQRPQLRARFADAVWEFGKRLSSIPGLYRYGLIAIDAYFIAANETQGSAFYESLQAVSRGIQLAAQLGLKDQVARGVQFMMEFADTAEPEHMGRWFAPFDRLMHQRGIGQNQREQIVIALERRFRETVAGQDLHRQKMAGQALAQYHHARRNYAKAKEITLAYGEAVLRLAESQSPMIAVHHLSGVVDDYLRMGLRENSDRVRVLLEERGRGASSEMREHVIEVKLELDDVERSIAEKLDHDDPYFALWRLAWSCSPDPAETIERCRKASEGLVFHQLFPVSIIGGDGLPVASLGSYDNDPEGRHVLEYTREMHLNANFFMIGIEEWKKKFERADFIEVEGLFDCLLIPEDRRRVFREGFAAYASCDYLKAIHVLIPQVENSLRKLLELVGVPLTKNDEEGGFELKNMNDVLHDETIRATLDERLWTFLKVLYTDKRGPNLRNMVMHGIAEPHEFNQANAALVLQSVMLLTIIRAKGIFFDQSENLHGDEPGKSD